MTKRATRRRWSVPSRSVGLTAMLAGVMLLGWACGDDDDGTTTTAPQVPVTSQVPATSQDPVSAAEARVADAETGLTEAEEALTSVSQQFCGEAEVYVEALDRYGKLFTDSAATVGDVTTGGEDLVEPRESVSAAADAVGAAQDDVASAEVELVDAQAALAEATASASSVPLSTTAPASTTSSTIVPQRTIERVQQAEDQLATTSEGITDATPLNEATVEYNSAAFALQIAWLQLLNEAGCFTDEQQAEAVQLVTEYTIALQTDLQKTGYYEGEIDGIYGPGTVDAVKQLQTGSGLPVTGVVDQATAAALDMQLQALGEQAADAALAQTSAVQTVLTLTGFWTGAIDGQWTDELTAALTEFQVALGVEPTGTVDAATLSAFEDALANLEDLVTATTTPPTTVSPTVPPTSPAPPPAPTEPATATTGAPPTTTTTT